MNLNKKKNALIAKLDFIQSQKSNIFARQNVQINIRQEDLEKRTVYDIEVEDVHEYFANRILVHNCSDAKRYIVTTALSVEYQNYLRGGKAAHVKSGKSIRKNSY